MGGWGAFGSIAASRVVTSSTGVGTLSGLMFELAVGLGGAGEACSSSLGGSCGSRKMLKARSIACWMLWVLSGSGSTMANYVGEGQVEGFDG